MKKSYLISAALALGVAFPAALFADIETGSAPPKPGVVEARTASISGTVDAIDYNARTVTLTGPDMGTVTLEVGPEAHRFKEVKKGDKVTFTYLESVAVMVGAPSDSVGSVEGEQTVVVRNKTQKPSGTAVHTKVA